MNRVLKKIKNISLLCFFFMLIMLVRPAYSIPSSLEEFQQMFGNLCYEYGLDFCASPPKSEEEGNKRKEFTETEKQILTRLSRQQSRMQEREMDMDRREQQLKALQEDVQRQISQLEKLQQEIERDIESKKTQDDALLDKAVSFYAKMDAATAAQSINQLETKVAVSILMRMKEKQAADVLSNIPPDQSAKLIAEIAKKK
jgi:flagellar motility protein MotE (MotC chaperone)|tara:strand:- start:1089 stop:1688 length:600 start_codon:yes stop_codon:yes gene_type:complete